MRTMMVAASLLLALVLIAAFATAPRDLEFAGDPLALPDDLDTFLATSEEVVDRNRRIIPGAEKRIRWHDPETRRRSDYVVVYLHGFSATRQELSPVSERVADELEANLFETRLAGHGLRVSPISGVTAEDWLRDADEALAIASRIGDHIILIGTSTGATLALAVSASNQFDNVDTIVLVSPNFAPRDENAEFLLMPGGALLARLLVGGTHTWTAANDLQAKYWSTAYPLDALVEMMRLVSFVRAMMPLQTDASLLWFYSPEDQVVNVDRIRDAVGRISGRRSEVITIYEAGDRSNHVLAGDILSPGNTEEVARRIVRYVRDGKR